MLTINLFDNNFPGQPCSVANQTPKRMRYVRDHLDWDGISFFTDARMFGPEVNAVTGKKYGWLHEGYELHPENYDRALTVVDKFDGIFTTEPDLIAENPKFLPAIRGGTWIPEGTWGMYPKSQSVAMITSEKNQTSGHKLRHEAAQMFPLIHHFGFYGEKIGTDKRRAYADYRFAVVIEAQKRMNFFSEHLLDALALGCIPIYWGCPNINQFFRYEGILTFNTLGQLGEILYYIAHNGESLYEQWKPFAIENGQRIHEYAVTEDWLVQHYLEQE